MVDMLNKKVSEIKHVHWTRLLQYQLFITDLLFTIEIIEIHKNCRKSCIQECSRNDSIITEFELQSLRCCR